MSTPAATTPFTLAGLASELTNDPASMGYAALIAAGSLGSIVTLINSLTSSGAASVYRSDVTIHDIVGAIVSTDYTALTAVKIAQLQLLFAGSSTIDASVANTRAIIVGIATGASSTTLANLAAIATRTGSRAEVLWGEGTTISLGQVEQATGGQ